MAWSEIYLAQLVSYKTVQATSFRAGMWPVAGPINAGLKMLIFVGLTLTLQEGKNFKNICRALGQTKFIDFFIQ